MSPRNAYTSSSIASINRACQSNFVAREMHLLAVFLRTRRSVFSELARALNCVLVSFAVLKASVLSWYSSLMSRSRFRPLTTIAAVDVFTSVLSLRHSSHSLAKRRSIGSGEG